MKKSILATVLATALLLTACNSEKPAETTVRNKILTTASLATSVATTTTTEEEEEDTTTRPLAKFTPDQYALVISEMGLASDFDWGKNATLGTNRDEENNIDFPSTPKYPAGEDVEISFKCYKKIEFDICKADPEMLKMNTPLRELCGSGQYPNVKNITKKCSKKSGNGRYTLKIPAEHLVANTSFEISLKIDGTWYAIYIEC